MIILVVFENLSTGKVRSIKIYVLDDENHAHPVMLLFLINEWEMQV